MLDISGLKAQRARMLSLVQGRGSSRPTSSNTEPHPDRVTITAPRRILEAATLHVNIRSRTPVTMPFFPLVTLENNPYGWSHLDPDYTYVVRRGRGRTRRNYFVRAAPRPAPPPSPEPPVIVIRRPQSYDTWPEESPCTCRRCTRPDPSHWFYGGGPRDSSDTDTDSDSARPSTPGRRVHWPDGHSDGSLPSDISSSSSTDISSDSNGPRGGLRVPRTPSGRPVRRRRYGSPSCRECHSMCATVGPRARYDGGGSRWRDAPCRERPVWDSDLGYGLVREPRC